MLGSKGTQDWICSVKWVQATPSDGAWSWTLWLVDYVDDKPVLRDPPLASGVAFIKLTVYWKVWRICRKRDDLRFRPNIRGKIEPSEDS